MASILIIEDDIVDLMAIKRSLVPLKSHKFSYAASIQEAHKLMSNHQFDLIFTDYYLGDGIATEISDTASPVILMTGLVEMPNPEIAQQFEDILVKDIKHSHLNKIVHTIQNRFNKNVPTPIPSTQSSAPLRKLSLSFGSDKSFLKKMLVELQKQLQIALNLLNQENASGTDLDLHKVAHKVKSQFLLGGFSQGAQIAEKLELAIQKEAATAEMIDPMVENLRTSLINAIAVIEKKLEEL